MRGVLAAGLLAEVALGLQVRFEDAEQNIVATMESELELKKKELQADIDASQLRFKAANAGIDHAKEISQALKDAPIREEVQEMVRPEVMAALEKKHQELAPWISDYFTKDDSEKQILLGKSRKKYYDLVYQLYGRLQEYQKAAGQATQGAESAQKEAEEFQVHLLNYFFVDKW